MIVIKDKEFPSGVLFNIDKKSRTASMKLSDEDYLEIRKISPDLTALGSFTLKFGDNFNESTVEFTEDGGPNHLKILY